MEIDLRRLDDEEMRMKNMKKKTTSIAYLTAGELVEGQDEVFNRQPGSYSSSSSSSSNRIVVVEVVQGLKQVPIPTNPITYY